MRVDHGVAPLLAGAALLVVSPVGASVTDFEPQGFTIELELTLPGSPEEIYDAITGDVSGWWDHSFSEKPAKFYVDPKPGGGFYEIFDESGDGVKHAEVIYAHRGKLLRLRGPLGLSGKAFDLVYSLSFEARGDSTHVGFVANGAGQIEEGDAELVSSVWQHFLIGQFKPWVEAGKHRTR
jgi:uncharacterized protein YndB with AHSA1/START domain